MHVAWHSVDALDQWLDRFSPERLPELVQALIEAGSDDWLTVECSAPGLHTAWTAWHTNDPDVIPVHQLDWDRAPALVMDRAGNPVVDTAAVIDLPWVSDAVLFTRGISAPLTRLPRDRHPVDEGLWWMSSRLRLATGYRAVALGVEQHGDQRTLRKGHGRRTAVAIGDTAMYCTAFTNHISATILAAATLYLTPLLHLTQQAVLNTTPTPLTGIPRLGTTA